MQQAHDELGYNIDMLDADRLLDWAERIEGQDWDRESRDVLARQLRDVAGRIQREVKDVGALRDIIRQQPVELTIRQAKTAHLRAVGAFALTVREATDQGRWEEVLQTIDTLIEIVRKEHHDGHA